MTFSLFLSGCAGKNSVARADENAMETLCSGDLNAIQFCWGENVTVFVDLMGDTEDQNDKIMTLLAKNLRYKNTDEITGKEAKLSTVTVEYTNTDWSLIGFAFGKSVLRFSGSSRGRVKLGLGAVAGKAGKRQILHRLAMA